MTLGARIGQDKFYDYVTMFGFREKTNVGLPGEQTGIHHAQGSMTALDLANCSFGQSFKITPMQLITAVSSVANGGSFMQPYIVKEIIDSKGNTVVSNEPTVVRKTVSEKTSEILREYLEYAVVKGKNGYVEGYKIAGKTGTSQKLDTRVNKEDNKKRIASFICFAPADDPQLCVLVVVDEPNSEVMYGSYIAAPLGRDIMKDSLDHLNYETSTVSDVPVPNVTDKTTSEAVSDLSKLNMQAKIVGNDGTVKYQLPKAGTELPEKSTVLLFTDEVSENTETTVPSLIGKTAAECNQLLVNSGLNIKVVGENVNYPNTVAVSQSISEGTTVKKMTVITVEFKQMEKQEE